MTIDLTQIILAAIGLVVSLVSVYAVPWLKSKVGAARWDQFMRIVNVAVAAAEQLGVTGTIKDKLEYAMDKVKITLEHYGLSYNEDIIRTAIESILNEWNHNGVALDMSQYSADDLIKLKEAGVIDVGLGNEQPVQ